MDIENVMNTIIEKEVSDELIWLTVSKYALFMSYGKIGIDAKALYEHYQFTCIMQKTNTVWAAGKYCRQGLDWGRDRFEKAKKLLLDLGMIEISQERFDSGKFGKIFIKVKMKKVELEPCDLDRMPEKPQAVETASGQTAPNALTNNINALTKKEIFIFWNSKDHLQKHRSILTFTNKYSNNRMKLLLHEYTIDEIKQSISNYNNILKDPKYYFKHSWPLWDYLTRGVDNFVDESKPFEKFKKTYNTTTPTQYSEDF